MASRSAAGAGGESSSHNVPLVRFPWRNEALSPGGVALRDRYMKQVGSRGTGAGLYWLLSGAGRVVADSSRLSPTSYFYHCAWLQRTSLPKVKVLFLGQSTSNDWSIRRYKDLAPFLQCGTTLFFFFWSPRLLGSWFLDQGSNPCPNNERVLTTGPPGKSQCGTSLKGHPSSQTPHMII